MEKVLTTTNKTKWNNVSRWTINMDNDVHYSTSGFDEQDNFMLELILKWRNAEIFRTLDAFDGASNIQKRILWLKLKDESVFISAYNKDNYNYTCFIKSEISPVRTWNQMKKKMSVYSN